MYDYCTHPRLTTGELLYYPLFLLTIIYKLPHQILIMSLYTDTFKFNYNVYYVQKKSPTFTPIWSNLGKNAQCAYIHISQVKVLQLEIIISLMWLGLTSKEVSLTLSRTAHPHQAPSTRETLSSQFRRTCAGFSSAVLKSWSPHYQRSPCWISKWCGHAFYHPQTWSLKHVLHSDKSREMRGPFLSAVVLTKVMLDNMKGSLKTYLAHKTYSMALHL